MRSFNALSIGVTGKTQAFTGTSAGSTIPVDAAGQSPNYCVFGATAACHVRVGAGSQTAVTTDLYLPANVPLILNTKGSSNFAVIQDSAGGNLYVTPLEWVR